MNRRKVLVVVLTMTVVLLSTVTIGRVGAASAPTLARVAVPERLADPEPVPIVGTGTGVPLFIGAAAAAQPGIVLITTWSDFARLIQSPSPSLVAAVYEFYAQGGLNAYVLPVATEDAAALGGALSTVAPVGPAAPQWDLIVIPALGSLSPTDWLTTAVHMTAVASAAQATALLDPPDESVVLAAGGQTQPLIDIAVQLKRALASPANAVLVSSDLTGVVLPISPTQPTAVSGAAVMAGLITATDVGGGVWTMPAGPAHPVNDLQPVLTVDDDLNSALAYGSIDSWRVLPGYGTVLFGELTVQGSGFDQWITRQRTTSWISRSIEAWLAQDVFATDAPPLWSAVDAGISTFLTQLWREGALDGTTAGEGFTVAAGLGTSMTPQDVAAGLLKVNVQLNISLFPPPVLTYQQQVQPGP